MFFGLKKPNKTKSILVLEIESGSIACARVLISEINKTGDRFCPQVKDYVRENFTYSRNATDESSRGFFDILFRTLEKVLAKIQTTGDQTNSPEAIYCFSGSPLYISQTTHLRLTEEKPFKVTGPLVKNLIDNHSSKLVNQFSVLHPGLVDDHIKLIESKLMKIYVNDYEVPDPYGLKTKQLELVHFSSLGSVKVIDRVEDILGRFYHDLPISWHSTAFALFNSLYLDSNTLPNMIILSVGGLNTEIVLIKNRLISEIVSIPFGEESIIQALHAKLNRPLEEIHSLFALQLSLGITDVSQTSLAPHFDQIKSEWDKNFTTGISALTNHTFLPKNILVVGHGPLSQIITKWVGQKDLAADVFGKKCTYVGDQSAAKDIHLMAEIIFCDTLIKQGQKL